MPTTIDGNSGVSRIVHKTSFTCAGITPANWEIIGRGWK